MKKLTTAHKVKHHIKARVEARAAKKSAKKSVHQVHADNLYKLAHPTSAKRQKAFRRSLTHVVLPISLIVATASFAIGAEVINNSSKAGKAAPPVPANSVCREYDAYDGGLAAEDHRIAVSFTHTASSYTTSFSGLPLNYLYLVTSGGYKYNLSNLVSSKITTGTGVAYLKACALNPGPAMPPFTSRNALVDQQYRDFYGRSATSAELAYWASTGYNAEQIVSWFVNNEKPQRGPLVRLYKAYYKRWPDVGGYDYWVRKMKSGTSLTSVSDFFANSNEFKSKYGSVDNEQFVILVYANVLNRTPDTAGYNYWVKQLNDKKITRGGVMLKFSESSEYVRKYGLDCDLQGVTLRMLRRPATDTELAQWNPDVDALALAYPILFDTPEYINRVVK